MSTLNVKNWLPMQAKFFPFREEPFFRRGLGVQVSKQGVTKVVSLVKMEEYLPSVYSKETEDYIRKTRLFKYIENFTTKKGKFSEKNFNIFHISAQNIDCGYSLEPPRRGSSNEYPQSMF